MAIASGIDTIVSYKKQSAQGTKAIASSAQSLRRVESSLQLAKDTYQSREKVSHQQIVDMRHGTRRVVGAINGELSPGTYADFMGSLLRKDFVAGATTGAITDVAAAAGPPGTFTRVTGSYLADGIKCGDVVQWSGWATATENNGVNYRITNLTATVMTVGTATTGASGGDEVVGAESAGASVTCTVVGKKTYMPTTGFTTDWYTIEHWYPGVTLSEQFYDVQVSGMRLTLPATGMATVGFDFVGLNMARATSLYFTSPTAATSTGIEAAVNGYIRVAGSDQGVITGATINAVRTLTGTPVVGSNYMPGLSSSQLVVAGQITAQLESGALRDLFVDETETVINLMLKTGSSTSADFLGLTMSRVKFGGAAKDDPEGPVIQTLPFQALIDTAGGSGTDTENSTLVIQDSTL